jgi:hypothetical protein
VSPLPDLLEPNIWDQVYYHDRETLRAVAATSDPALGVRAAHAYYTLTQDAEGTLRRLHKLETAPALGVRLLALCELEQFSRVLAQGFKPRGASPLELEETVYAEWALSIAAGALHRHDEALAHLERATVVAEALGLQGRLTVLSLERERQRSYTNRPDAERILQAARASKNPKARRFGYETYVEGLLAEGRYAHAAETAQRYRLEPDIVAFTSALALSKDHGEDHPPTPLGALAQGFWELHEGENKTPLPQLPDEPFRVYAQLLSVARLTQNAQNDLARLNLPRHGAPDQRALSTALAWVHWLRTGQSGGQPLTLPAALNTALSVLHSADLPARWLVALAPEEMLLLKLSAQVHPDVERHLVYAPILQDGYVTVAGQHLTVPKSAAQALLRDADTDSELEWASLARSTTKRFRDNLAAVGVRREQLINPVRLYTLATRYYQHAALYGKPAETYPAERALKLAESLLPESVKNIVLAPGARVA